MTRPGRTSTAPLSLKARAISLLAQREHSPSELRRKLLQIASRRRAQEAAEPAGVDAGAAHQDPAEAASEAAVGAAATIDALIVELADKGYLSETRFVESRVNVRAQRCGVQRIQQELAQHGMRLSADQQTALRDTEFARCRAVWLRRFGEAPDAEPAAQARQMRFLMARGFSAEVIRRVLRQGPSLD